jgi:Kef-type K+ transport system membrane component KefB
VPPIDLILLDLVVILIAARALGTAAQRLGQPQVIGEIMAGIVLGPTLLGHFIGHRLFPASVLPSLTTLADVGLVLFMFVIGVGLDQTLVRGRIRIAAGVAVGATVLPLTLGCGLALWLAHSYAHGRTLAFVLFFGTAVSATAFPVLARIVTDRGMQEIRIGDLALAAAAIIDVMAWILLAIAVALVSAVGGDSWHIELAPVYVLVMFLVVRPLLRRLVPALERAGRLTPGMLSIILIGLLASAWATQWMQIHFIFGAFLFGVLMPRSDALIRQILERLEQLAVQLLLPIFFVVTGLTVDLSALRLSAVGVLAAILAVSIGGKLAGGYAGSRLSGLSHHGSAVLAVLVNTRGLTEIVILTVGLQVHVLNTELYSLMIVMALVTTTMTGPLLDWCYPRSRVAHDIAEAQQAALGARIVHRVLVMPSSPGAGSSMVRLATELSDGKAEVTLAHLWPYPAAPLEVGLGLSAQLAEMAGPLMELEALVAEMPNGSAPARVVSRFASDVPAELAALVKTAAPSCVLLDAATAGYEIVQAAVTGRLITVARPDLTGSPIVVPYDSSASATAAVQVGLWIASLRREPLLLVGGGRASRLARQLAGLGVEVYALSAKAAQIPPGALVIGAGGQLWVRAEQAPGVVDWASSVVPSRVNRQDAGRR